MTMRVCTFVAVVLGLVSVSQAETSLSDGALTIDGSDYEMSGDLSVNGVTFKTANRIFGTGTLTVAATKSITVNQNVSGAIFEVPVYDSGNLYINVAAGATLTFNDNLQAADCLMGTVEGELVFNSTTSFRYDWYNSGTGSIRFKDQSKSYGYGRYWLKVAKHYLEVEDAWCLDNTFSYVTFKDNCTIDCCGKTQHFKYLSQDSGKVGTVYSEQPTTVYLTGTADSTFAGVFAGAIDVSYAGNGKKHTLSGTSTSCGTLMVTNGATVEITGQWAGCEVSVADNSKIVLAASEALTKLTDVRVLPTAGTRGRISVPSGVIAKVKTLDLGGTVYDTVGSYGSSASGADYQLDDWFEGEGVVYVTRGTDVGGTYTWTGGAGGADRTVQNNANWGDVAADYSSGLSAAVFATGGTGVDLTTAANFKGVTFSAAAAQADFSINQGTGGSLVVGADGITVSTHEDGTARAHVINVPYKGVLQTIDVKAAGDSLTFSSGLAGANEVATITKIGAGSLILDGQTSVPGGLQVLNGACCPANGGDAVGVAGSKIVVDQTSGGTLQLTTALDTASAMEVKSVDGNSTAVALLANTQNEVAGAVKMTARGFSLPSSSTLTFSGGLDLAGGWFWMKDDGTYVVQEKPVTVSGGSGIYMYTSHLRLETANNELGNYVNIYYEADPSEVGNIICTVPWALNFPKSTFALGTSSGWHSAVIDLGGFDQGVQKITTASNSKSQGKRRCRVTSATPAVLYERTSDTRTSYIDYHGAAGYCLVGVGNITLGWTSETTGSLGVTNGTLTVGADAAWPNASAVVISHAGHFVLTEANQLGKQVVVSLSDSGTINIPAGVRQKCAKLVLDGVECRGVWGKPGSGAEHTDERFVGDGLLQAGPMGLMLIFR